MKNLKEKKQGDAEKRRYMDDMNINESYHVAFGHRDYFINIYVTTSSS